MAVDVILLALNVLGLAALIYVEVGLGDRFSTLFQDFGGTLPGPTEWMLAYHGALWVSGLLSVVAITGAVVRHRRSAIVGRLVAGLSAVLFALAIPGSTWAMCFPVLHSRRGGVMRVLVSFLVLAAPWAASAQVCAKGAVSGSPGRAS